MACGDTAAQWVPALGASVWSGEITDSETAVVATFVAADNLAATVVGEVPLVGVWSHDGSSNSFTWTAATGGISYTFTVAATSCDAGKVTAADGGVGDSFNQGHPFEMTRTL